MTFLVNDAKAFVFLIEMETEEAKLFKFENLGRAKRKTVKKKNFKELTKLEIQ